jgi:hypothetical protein
MIDRQTAPTAEPPADFLEQEARWAVSFDHG